MAVMADGGGRMKEEERVKRENKSLCYPILF